nr:unnamed protein product [Digitaria exilis]
MAVLEAKPQVLSLDSKANPCGDDRPPTDPSKDKGKGKTVAKHKPKKPRIASSLSPEWQAVLKDHRLFPRVLHRLSLIGLGGLALRFTLRGPLGFQQLLPALLLLSVHGLPGSDFEMISPAFRAPFTALSELAAQQQFTPEQRTEFAAQDKELRKAKHDAGLEEAGGSGSAPPESEGPSAAPAEPTPASTTSSELSQLTATVRLLAESLIATNARAEQREQHAEEHFQFLFPLPGVPLIGYPTPPQLGQQAPRSFAPPSLPTFNQLRPMAQFSPSRPPLSPSMAVLLLQFGSTPAVTAVMTETTPLTSPGSNQLGCSYTDLLNLDTPQTSQPQPAPSVPDSDIQSDIEAQILEAIRSGIEITPSASDA